MSRSVRFNINNPDIAGIGKFGIQGTNDEGVAADFYFAATLAGNTVIAETLVAGNVSNGANYSNYNLDLAVDSSTGLLMTGVYALTITAKVVGGSTVLNTYNQSFGFNPYGATRIQELLITDTIDCVNGEFTLFDSTPYRTSSDTLVTRAWTITPPSVSGSSVGSIVTGANSYVKIAFPYVNVTYQAYLESTINYTNATIATGAEIDIYESHKYTLDYNYFVDCDNNLCEIKQCLYDTLASLNTAACRLGGFDKLNANDRAKWYSLQQYLAGWQVANECMDATNRQAYFLKLKDLLDCGCDENVQVKKFTLPDGSEQVQTAWATVATTFDNSFVNGPIPLRWRIDRDNRLNIVGEIQMPAGLAIGTPVQITTGFISTSLVASIPNHKIAAVSAAGLPLGAVKMNSNSDFDFIPNSNYVGSEFIHINYLYPLD